LANARKLGSNKLKGQTIGAGETGCTTKLNSMREQMLEYPTVIELSMVQLLELLIGFALG